jgi:N-acetylglucosamine-6-phosphate deacetylase
MVLLPDIKKIPREPSMKKQVIINAIIYDRASLPAGINIVVENGIITSLQKEIPGDAEIIDLDGKGITAALIDIQINGGEELYFAANPNREALQDMYESSLRTGTGYIFPCLISSPFENMLQAIEAVRGFKKDHEGILGIHLEGPYMHPNKRGAHPLGNLRKPTTGELNQIIASLSGLPAIMTLAPELFSNRQLALLREAGIILSAGHSSMNYAQSMRMFKQGIKLVTHLYNAMPPFHHREPGLIGAALDHEEIYVPLVLDGAHCHSAAARLAWKIKPDKTILISDASFLGRKKQSFSWGEFNMTLQNGYYRNNQGQLAGSAISLFEAVQFAVSKLGIPVAKALAMANVQVAEALGMQSKVGSIAPGYPARFTVFDEELKMAEVVISEG